MEQTNPYAPPAETFTKAERPPVKDIFRSTQTLATWLIGLLVLRVVLYVAALALDAWQLNTLHAIPDGEYLDAATAGTIDRATLAIGLPLIAVIAAGAIVFLVWLYRAYANLFPLGAEHLNSTPGWAVGVYFIPIFNLFRPYQVMAELWRKSDVNVWTTEAKSAAIVGWWWGGCIAAWLASRASFRAASRVENLSDLIVSCYVSLVESSTAIVMTVLTIVVVRGIVRMQTERAAKVLSPSDVEFFE